MTNADGAQKLMKSHITLDGGNEWKNKVLANPHSFEEVYLENDGADIVKIEQKRECPDSSHQYPFSPRCSRTPPPQAKLAAAPAAAAAAPAATATTALCCCSGSSPGVVGDLVSSGRRGACGSVLRIIEDSDSPHGVFVHPVEAAIADVQHGGHGVEALLICVLYNMLAVQRKRRRKRRRRRMGEMARWCRVVCASARAHARVCVCVRNE